MRTAPEIVEAYFHALRTRDLSRAPLAADVTYQGLGGTRRSGREVAQHLATLFPSIRGIRCKRHVVEGAYVASVFELETRSGVAPFLGLFRLENGLIKEILVSPDLEPRGSARRARRRPRAESGSSAR